MEFNASIKYLKGVGEKRAALLAKLGIFTLWDLLTFYPRIYEDWSKISTINDAAIDENVCIRGIVGTRCREHRIRKGMTLYKTEITDGSDLLDVTFFNNKYAAENIQPFCTLCPFFIFIIKYNTAEHTEKVQHTAKLGTNHCEMNGK